MGTPQNKKLSVDLNELRGEFKGEVDVDIGERHIKLLDPAKKYPEGLDGLASEGLSRYGYLIDEHITFKAPKTAIRGAHGMMKDRTRDPDLIFIQGGTVSLVQPDSSL